ncbi:MAG: hypothetical protein U0X39_01955 [Bacteroidales bacterium]
MKRLFSSVLMLFLFVWTIQSQLVTGEGRLSDHKVTEWYKIDIDNQVLESLSHSEVVKDAPFQFAIPLSVNLDPDNSGVVYNDGDEKIWQLGIVSKSARSLNLILDPFIIPEGAYVYIYDADRKNVRGAIWE